MIGNDLKHFMDEQIEIVFQEFISKLELREELFRDITMLAGRLHTKSVPRAESVLNGDFW
ncbi:MAG: hypothetical protein WA395_13265 [Nitrososphaeraceae archaeon]